MVLLASFLCFYSSSLAHATESSFDSTTTTTPDTLDLNDGTITNPSGGCPSGTTAAQVNYSNWSRTTVRWGECVNTFAISYAINQALSESGISIDKAHYSWRYVHCFNTPDDFCSNNISNRVNTQTGEITDDTYWDILTVTVEVTDSDGNVVKSETWSMDKWYAWNADNNHSNNEINISGVRWQIHEGNIELYNHIDKVGTIYTPNQLGDVRFRIQGQDKGNWDGYYGPVITDIQTWFTYRANPCNDTALYDPSCPGYAQAYAQYEYDQNCAANALYDPGCPGYAQANYNAQCSADPLYDSGCPGYAQAYYTQQCNADPLYDSGCNGYDAAYLAQQCAIDSHHSTECPNYYWANLEGTSAFENVAGQGSDFIEVLQSHHSNAYKILKYNESEIDNGDWRAVCLTYDNGCEDAMITSVTFNQVNGVQYAFLYTQDEDGNTFVPTNGHEYYFYTDTKLTALCNVDTLYSQFCDGYEEAYAQYQFDQNCAANTLFDENCPGYATAYFDYQCSANSLYNSECPGYATAYYNYQCSADPLYDAGCPGYATAYYNLQCSANPLYETGCQGYEEAYFTQQCTVNPLYDTECDGYDTAYYNAQCTASPLYDSGCEGHFEAQCEANTLYDFRCTGYEQAYFDQQCTFNPQYDEQCPGYVEPVVETSPEDLVDDGTGTGDAIVDSVIDIPAPTIPELIIMPQPPAPAPEPIVVEPIIEVEVETIEVVTVEQIEAEVEQQLEVEVEPVEEIVVEPVREEPVEETVDEPIEETVEENTTEDTTEDKTEDTTEETVEEDTVEEETKEEEVKEESKEEKEETVEETKEETVEPVATKKVTKVSKKQKEKSKRAKMKKIIKDKLKKLAEVMGKAATLEQQQAVQAQISALINYVPGFNAYGQMYIPGTEFYQPDDMWRYKDKKVPENNRGLLNGLASELLHEKMVDQQYKDMNNE